MYQEYVDTFTPIDALKLTSSGNEVYGVCVTVTQLGMATRDFPAIVLKTGPSPRFSRPAHLKSSIQASGFGSMDLSTISPGTKPEQSSGKPSSSNSLESVLLCFRLLSSDSRTSLHRIIPFNPRNGRYQLPTFIKISGKA